MSLYMLVLITDDGKSFVLDGAVTKIDLDS